MERGCESASEIQIGKPFLGHMIMHITMKIPCCIGICSFIKTLTSQNARVVKILIFEVS